ncbi:MAG: CoA pyrophosphatase [Myxococcales bacterium]|nr:CoA pyrophosphatase [Myxococcales bacterium]
MAGALPESLRQRLRENLQRFSRRQAPSGERRRAAVALVIGADASGGPCFVLTRRASGLRAHAGQWALPGGRMEPGERVEQTARRETAEEVGLELGAGAVLGLLDDYATRSGFLITPVVLWHGGRMRFAPDPGEVARVFEIPVSDLAAPEVPQLEHIAESEHPVISLPLRSVGSRIHAPTAAIIYQLWEVAFAGRTTRVAHFEQPLFAWK